MVPQYPSTTVSHGPIMKRTPAIYVRVEGDVLVIIRPVFDIPNDTIFYCVDFSRSTIIRGLMNRRL
jgi:hypothetical protein